MHILYDLRAAQPNKAGFHGGGEYAKVVFGRLMDLKEGEKISAFYSPERELGSEVRKKACEGEVELIAVEGLQDLERLLQSGDYTRCYTALPYGYYDVDFHDTEIIFTIHGLRAVERPTDKHEMLYCDGIREYAKFGFKQLLEKRYRSIKLSQFGRLISIRSKKTNIVVPSRHTKYSLLSHFPYLDAERVRVLYSPLKELPSNDSRLDRERRLAEYEVSPRSFFLVTSARRWVKNAYRAIRALDKVFSSFGQVDNKVLVLGARDNSPLQRGLKNREQFVFRGYVSEEDLNLLYSEAYAFVYPTLNEGFGYPPLESMRYGTPVLAAATSAVTEVCGDAVLYFEPRSIAEIKNRILAILFEEGLWQAYAERGKRRFEEVSVKQKRMLDELCQLILGR